MSFVEKALQKMRDSAKAESAARPAVAPGTAAAAVVESVGRVSESAARVVEVPAPAVQPAGAPAGATIPPYLRTEPGRYVKIDTAALREIGLLPPAQEERRLAQQYRQIKRPLIANAIGRGGERQPQGQTIMIASALPGEGKTFTTVNLAFSMALEKGIRVVLVDADVGKPQLSRLFGLEDAPGLLDALRDPLLDIESLLVDTDIPGLQLLPAGKRSEDATELLSSSRMADVETMLTGRDPNRIVVLDSPPLLITPESHALAQSAGQIVLVVRSRVTKQRDVMDALSHIGHRPCVSLLLNQSISAAKGGYYYYGYGESFPTEAPPR
jgi:exopolysaccharide/PEP-CTERM locus tyrosine autokinase